MSIGGEEKIFLRRRKAFFNCVRLFKTAFWALECFSEQVPIDWFVKLRFWLCLLYLQKVVFS